jgi:hypothetical protein
VVWAENSFECFQDGEMMAFFEVEDNRDLGKDMHAIPIQAALTPEKLKGKMFDPCSTR